MDSGESVVKIANRRAKTGAALVQTLIDHDHFVLAARLELLWEVPVNRFENSTAEEKLRELEAGAAQLEVIKEEVEELGFIDGRQIFKAEIMELEELMREFRELIDATTAEVERLVIAIGVSQSLPDPPPEAPSEVKEAIAKLFDRYDLDSSGAIDAPEELRQLATNVLCTLRLDVDYEDVMADCAKVDVEKEPFDLPGFQTWFQQQYGGAKRHEDYLA